MITQVFYFTYDNSRIFSYDKKMNYVIAELGTDAYPLTRAKSYVAKTLDCPLLQIDFQKIDVPEFVK